MLFLDTVFVRQQHLHTVLCSQHTGRSTDWCRTEIKSFHGPGKSVRAMIRMIGPSIDWERDCFAFRGHLSFFFLQPSKMTYLYTELIPSFSINRSKSLQNKTHKDIIVPTEYLRAHAKACQANRGLTRRKPMHPVTSVGQFPCERRGVRTRLQKDTCKGLLGYRQKPTLQTELRQTL